MTERTYYRRRKNFGGIRTDQAKRLKDRERANAQLKRQLATAELDKSILRKVGSGHF